MTDEIEDAESTTNKVCNVVLVLGTPLWLVWGAYADMKLWLWFVVPLGLPALTLPHALGLGLLIRAFTHQVRKPEPATRLLGAAITAPAIFLAIGWCVRAWMVAP